MTLGARTDDVRIEPDRHVTVAYLTNQAHLFAEHRFLLDETRRLYPHQQLNADVLTAAVHLEENEYGFDYLDGRILKMNLSGAAFDPWGYNRDNGTGFAARVVTHLRETGSIEKIA